MHTHTLTTTKMKVYGDEGEVGGRKLCLSMHWWWGSEGGRNKGICGVLLAMPTCISRRPGSFQLGLVSM